MAALRLVGHQPGFAQHLEVFGHSGATQLELLAEFARRHRLPGEDLQQLPPNRIRQGQKDAVRVCHTGQYMSAIPDMSTMSDAWPARRTVVAATLLGVHFAWERLTDSVHRCRLPFCDVTVGLVRGRTGAMLVDTGTTLSEAAEIDSDAQRLAGRQVSHIMLTHKHFDHVLGASRFSNAEIYCAPEVVEHLTSATDQLRDDAVRHGADPTEIDRAIAALRAPQHPTYHALVDLGDRTVTITYLGRGHTASDLVVVAPGLEDSDPVVVFTGDLVEESADPAIDADSDLAAWPVTLDRLLTVGGPEAIYVPGHGAVVDAEFVRRQRDWLARHAGGAR